MHALGIDLGTGSVKAALVDASGGVVAIVSRRYVNATPHPGWVEIDPAIWWDAVGGAVREVAAGRHVAAVGLSGQMHSVVLIDGDGAPVRPAILWPDRRAGQEAQVYRGLPADMRRALANPPSPGMAGPLLMWLATHEPAAVQRAAYAVQPKDWLRRRLTGTVGTDPSDASATLLYDVTRDGRGGVAGAVGIPEALLPAIEPSAARAGALTVQAAAELALEPGLPVAAGAADTAAALVGAGATRAGDAVLTVGTGAQLSVVLEEPTVDPAAVTHLFRTAAGAPWYAMAGMQTGGLALERAWRWLGCDWPEAYRALAESPPGAGGATFLPYVSGERTPFLDPTLRAGWSDLSVSTTRADLVRAAFEGVACSIRAGRDALAAAGHAIRCPVLAGGGASHPLWRQLLADVLGTPLDRKSVV